METEGSLPHLQAPANCPYPETDQSSSCPPPTQFLKINFLIVLSSTSRFSKCAFSSGLLLLLLLLPPNILLALLLSLIFDTYPAQFMLLVSTTRLIYRADLRPLSSPCFSLFHYPVSWSGFGQYTILNTQFSSTLNLFLYCLLRSLC